MCIYISANDCETRFHKLRDVGVASHSNVHEAFLLQHHKLRRHCCEKARSDEIGFRTYLNISEIKGFTIWGIKHISLHIIQSNLSTATTFGTQKAVRCSEAVVIWCNISSKNVIWEGQKADHCRKVFVIHRWSLTQVWLYLNLKLKGRHVGEYLFFGKI